MSGTKFEHVNLAVTSCLGCAAYQFTLNDWVSILTIVFLVIQITLLLPKWYLGTVKIIKWFRSKWAGAKV